MGASTGRRTKGEDKRWDRKWLINKGQVLNITGHHRNANANTVRYFFLFFNQSNWQEMRQTKRSEPVLGAAWGNRDASGPCRSEYTFVEHFWEGNLATWIKTL